MQNLSSSFNTGIIVLAVSFVMLLIGVVVTYFWIIKKHFSDVGKIKKFDDQIAENANKIIQQARVEAEQMRKDASMEAQKIIENATNFQEQRDKVIGQELKNIEETYKKEFEQTIVAVQNNIQSRLSGLPDEIKVAMQNEVAGYRQNFREELNKTLSTSRDIIKEAYDKLQQDIEVYKQQRFAQIDNSIIEIVKITSREVLGKQLSIDEHEKLVLKTLEQAKKEKII